VTRFGLADLEAGYVLDRVHAQAGDILRASYTVRNTSRMPKLWLEVHNPTSLPTPLPGQAISLGSRGERSWSVRVPLARRGHFRVEHQTDEGEALRDDERFAYVAAWGFEGVGAEPTLHREPLAFEDVALAQRSYK